MCVNVCVGSNHLINFFLLCCVLGRFVLIKCWLGGALEFRQLSWANGNTNIYEHLLVKSKYLIYIPHTFFGISQLMLCGANGAERP